MKIIRIINDDKKAPRLCGAFDACSESEWCDATPELTALHYNTTSSSSCSNNNNNYISGLMKLRTSVALWTHAARASGVTRHQS